MMACESGDCTHRFCTYCLAVHLGINIDLSAGKGDGWACPTCSSKCCCSQPECNKAHRHCKAYRYRCRRAAAASLRMSAAHALVSLGVSPSPNQPKHTTNPDTISRTSLRDVPCHDLILFATLLQDLALGHVPVGPHWGSRCLVPIRGVQLERPLPLWRGHGVDGDPR